MTGVFGARKAILSAGRSGAHATLHWNPKRN
jgi:hypothetical protein